MPINLKGMSVKVALLDKNMKKITNQINSGYPDFSPVKNNTFEKKLYMPFADDTTYPGFFY